MDRSCPVDEIVQHVAAHSDRVLWLVLAFDGVLVDYVRDPASASLSRSVRKALRRLARQSGVALGIVSGRRFLIRRGRRSLRRALNSESILRRSSFAER